MARFSKALVFALFIGLGLYGFFDHALLPGIACLLAGGVAGLIAMRRLGQGTGRARRTP